MSATTEFSTARRWLMFTMVLVVDLVCYINFFKGVPIFPAIGGLPFFEGQNIGLLMSAGGIAGLIMAYPLGFLMRKISIKTTFLLICACTIVGGLIGCVSTNFMMLFIGRIIECLSLGWLAIAAPTAVSGIFLRKQQGLPLGIHCVMFPIGTSIAQMTIPSIYLSTGESWKVIWIIALVLGVIAAVYTFLIFKQPPQAEEDVVVEEKVEEVPASKAKIKPDIMTIIFLSVIMFLWGLWWTGAVNSGSFNSFLVDAKNLDIVTAGMIVALPNMICIFASPLSGFVVDRIGNRKWIITGAWVAAVIVSFVMFGDSMPLIWVGLALAGLVAGAIPAVPNALCLIAAKDPKNVSLAMATFSVGSSCGVVFGPAILPSLLESLDYAQAGLYYLVPICVVGVLLAVFSKDIKKAIKK